MECWSNGKTERRHLFSVLSTARRLQGDIFYILPCSFHCICSIKCGNFTPSLPLPLEGGGYGWGWRLYFHFLLSKYLSLLKVIFLSKYWHSWWENPKYYYPFCSSFSDKIPTMSGSYITSRHSRDSEKKGFLYNQVNGPHPAHRLNYWICTTSEKTYLFKKPR